MGYKPEIEDKVMFMEPTQKSVDTHTFLYKIV